MVAEDGLKAQKLLAQGSALGNIGKMQSRPEREKAFNFKSFCPFRASCLLLLPPGCYPGLGAFALSGRS